MASLQGGQEPSCADHLFAPFHPDPSQRLLAIQYLNYVPAAVMKAETVLRLAQERKGEDLWWPEWEEHVTWVTHVWRPNGRWVSGSRLCCAYAADFEFENDCPSFAEVYDFSAKAPWRDPEVEITNRTDSFPVGDPSTTKNLPFEMSEIINAYGCHDSIVFAVVNIPHSSNSSRN